MNLHTTHIYIVHDVRNFAAVEMIPINKFHPEKIALRDQNNFRQYFNHWLLGR